MRVAVAVIAAALVLGSANASTAGHTSTQAYQPGIGDLTVQCGPNRGGACFAPRTGETNVSASARDDNLNPVGIVLQFQDQDGVTVGALTPGCGQVPVTRIPANARVVVVSVDGPVFGPTDCLGQGIGIGTWGSITAVFS